MVHCRPCTRVLRTLALLATAGFVGCGSSSAEPESSISGTVTYRGEKVTEGIVSFYDQSRGAVFQDEIDEQGRYELPAVTHGSYKVTVIPLPPPETMGADGAVPTAKDPENIPKAYRSAKTTPFEQSVDDTTNEYNLELE